LTRLQLLAAVRDLQPTGPISDRLGKVLRPGPYANQRMHWTLWLGDNKAHEAATIYNRILCGPMLLWLAEASGVPLEQLERAEQAALAVGPPSARRCGALRRIIPWACVQEKLVGD
jgi:hypothetical protein